MSKAGDFGNPDLVILPGSKNTMEDLLWLRQSGLEGKVLRHASSGKPVFGICGGYQMLGEEICDPEGVERGGTIKAMGLYLKIPREEPVLPESSEKLPES